MNTLRMKWRPILALLVTLVMVFGMLPNVALAADTYTVSFNLNGGFTGSMAPVTVSGEYTLPPNGFTAWSTEYFRGWDVNGALKQPGEKITVTEDITIKAVCQKKDYGIIVGGVAITRDNAADV